MGSLYASQKWSFSGKKKFLYSIIKIYDVNYYLKLRKYTFCNLTIFELVNEIGDFESLCKVLCTRNCTKALKNIHNSKYSGSKKKIHYQEEWGSQVINAHKLMTAALSTDYNSPRSFRYIHCISDYCAPYYLSPVFLLIQSFVGCLVWGFSNILIYNTV